MTTEEAIQQEPLLYLLRDHQFISHTDVSADLEPLSTWESSSRVHALTMIMSKYVQQIEEIPLLNAILTHPILSGISEKIAGTGDGNSLCDLYIPAPGRNDARPLSPHPTSPEYIDCTPIQFRRTLGFIVTNPIPKIILLTFDPKSLEVLHDHACQQHWIARAIQMRPDLEQDLQNPDALVVGFTSPHQFFTQSQSWRRFPSSSHSEVCEKHGLDVFLTTPLGLHAWYSPLHPIEPRTLSYLSNLICRRIIIHPAHYPNKIGTTSSIPTPPSYSLLDPNLDHWKNVFLQFIDNCAANYDSDIHILGRADGGISLNTMRNGNLTFISAIPSSSAIHFIKAALHGSKIEIDQNPEKPKDGRYRIFLPKQNRSIDIRVSITPGAAPFDTPSVVLRLQDPTTVRGGIEAILLDDKDREAWDYALNLSSGIVFVTGPTGSGKSRTLYCALQSLHELRPGLAFKSVEDPIEYFIGDWFGQNQISPDEGVTFATLLRALLRSNPNVIFIGEIRDGETATIAMQAALSGHLVFTTIHVSEPALVPDRLKDFGISPKDVSNVLRLATGQRLVGRSCHKCRATRPATQEECFAHGLQPGTAININHGCPHCSFSGIKGRLALQEYVISKAKDPDPAIAQAIARADTAEIRSLMKKRGFLDLSSRAAQMATAQTPILNWDSATHIE